MINIISALVLANIMPDLDYQGYIFDDRIKYLMLSTALTAFVTWFASALYFRYKSTAYGKAKLSNEANDLLVSGW